MNKKTLIAKVARQTGYTRADVAAIYDAVIASLLEEIKARNKLAMPDLLTGKMIVKSARPPRLIKIPSTERMGMTRSIPSRRVFRMKLTNKAMRQVDDCL